MAKQCNKLCQRCILLAFLTKGLLFCPWNSNGIITYASLLEKKIYMRGERGENFIKVIYLWGLEVD